MCFGFVICETFTGVNPYFLSLMNPMQQFQLGKFVENMERTPVGNMAPPHLFISLSSIYTLC